MEGISVAECPRRGRHIVATQAFSAGQIVLQQAPYAAVLYDEQVPGRCDFCYALCSKPLRCARSKLARYCSREHQKLAWERGYREECESLAKLAPRVPPPTVRLAARALWRRQRAQSGGQHAEEGFHCYAAVEGLLHHWDKLDDARKSLYAQMAVVTWQYLHGDDKTSPADAADALDTTTATATSASASGSGSSSAGTGSRWPGVRDIALLLARFASNNHTICDSELRPLGAGIYPLGALVNHSCTPNCMQSFEGATIQFRAIRPIQAGEEVTIAYIELAATAQERRESLAESYFFDVRPTAAGAAAAAGSGGDVMLGPMPAIPPPPPPLPAAAAAAAAAGSGLGQKPAPLGAVGVGAAGGTVRLYRCSSEAAGDSCDGLPPWPTDPHDAQLTQVAVLVARGGSCSKSGGGSGGGELRVVSGGLQARAVRRDVTGLGLDLEEVDDGAAAGPASAAAAERGADINGQQQQGAASTGGSSSSSRRGRGPEAEVDAWGRWCTCLLPQATAGAAASADVGASANDNVNGSAGVSGSKAGVDLAAMGLGTSGVAAFVGRVAQAALLLAQAEEVSQRQGGAVAIRLLQQARQLCGPLPVGSGSDTNTTATHDAGHRQMLEAAPGSSSSSSHPPIALPALTLGPAHVLRMRIDAALMKTCIDCGDAWSEALGAARALVLPYSLLYPPPAWPNMALHYAALCKLELYCGEVPKAFQAAEAAMKQLAITHSHVSAKDVVDEVRRIHYESGCELQHAQQQQQQAQAQAAMRARGRPSGVVIMEEED